MKFFVTFVLTIKINSLFQPPNLRDYHTIHCYSQTYQDTKEYMMKNKLLLALFIVLLGGVISFLFAGNLYIYAGTLLVVGILVYFIRINNRERKENLNIIRDENRLYFYLSDDLLFSVDLLRNKSFTQTLRESIKNEMATLQDITRKICFINFKDDNLLNELNSKFKIVNKK